MPRFFNTTGPCDPAQHYMLPPRARLPDLLPLVERQLYFVVHAPRQTGKTTAMRAFAEELRAAGTVALWVTLEEARGEPEVAVAEAIILNYLKGTNLTAKDFTAARTECGAMIKAVEKRLSGK